MGRDAADHRVLKSSPARQIKDQITPAGLVAAFDVCAGEMTRQIEMAITNHHQPDRTTEMKLDRIADMLSFHACSDRNID